MDVSALEDFSTPLRFGRNDKWNKFFLLFLLFLRENLLILRLENFIP